MVFLRITQLASYCAPAYIFAARGRSLHLVCKMLLVQRLQMSSVDFNPN